MADPLFGIDLITLQGEHKTLADFPGKVLLIVNTASRCGFTPQYRELEMLWQRYRERGLMVLGFPCNQFGAQEPGTAQEIAEFCDLKYAVTFPMFQKIDVNGEHAHLLFRQLKTRAPGFLGSRRIKWNFTKFLVSGDGKSVRRFAPVTKPQKLAEAIEQLL